MKKIWAIIKSRFEKEHTNDLINERRAICKECPSNTFNGGKLSFKIKVIKLISDFYTFISLSKAINRGTCGECGCPITLKSRSYDE